MGGIIQIKCPDCSGQVHKETYINLDDEGRDSYSKYYCIGDKNLPEGSDGRKFRKSGCGFFAESKGPSDDRSTKIRSEKFDDWNQWDAYRGEC